MTKRSYRGWQRSRNSPNSLTAGRWTSPCGSSRSSGGASNWEQPSPRPPTPKRKPDVLGGWPPFCAESGRAAHVTDDKPHFVRALAVEVHVAPITQTEYRLGSDLEIAGESLLQVDLDCLAPNDIAASPSQAVKISSERDQFASALVQAWPRVALAPGQVGAVVVRHRPGRDEDNTWGNLARGSDRAPRMEPGALG